MVKRLSRFFDNFELIFSAVFLVTMVIALLFQVFFRYVIGKSLPWSEELSRLCFLYMVFLATSVAAKNRSHIRVTSQFNGLPAKIRKIFLVLGDIVWLSFNTIVIYQGIKLFIDMGERPLMSQVLGINLKYMFIIIPLGFFVQSLRILQGYYLDYSSKKKAVV